MAEDKPIVFVLYYTERTILDLPSLYTPLMSGSAFFDKQSLILEDDSGDNISSKNRYYSELTGIF